MTDSTAVAVDARVRCSNADRERTAERLRAAAADGYLTMDEFEERVQGVYTARYRQDLAVMVEDLPGDARPRPAGGWLLVLAMVLEQLRRDLALLLGRGAPGWTRRRIGVALATAFIVVVILAGTAGAALHGFGGDGFDGRGFGPGGGFPGRHH